MQKCLWFFLFFSLFPGRYVMADAVGLWAGLYAGNSDVLADEKDYFLTPALEYERSFGRFDLHAGAEYTFTLIDFFPQFFYADEKAAIHLPLGSFSEFLLAAHNENEFRFNPDKGGGQSLGTVKPELGYGLFLPGGDVSFALGSPIRYSLQAAEDTLFGIDVTAAYVAPFWLGFKAAAKFIAAPDAAFDGVEFAVNYAQDQFYWELAFNAEQSLEYLSLKAEFDYFFNFFVLKAALECGGLNDRDAVTLSPALGIQYRF
ncbi:MAG: hypothetical protein LBD44_01120 [Spirochaetaceae bacterium]|jgi:hypothetical protein|nr:hypothetical protein [Spirochaetaceae bacterium]